MKTELMTSLAFFSLGKQAKYLEQIRKALIPDITRAACGMEAGQCVWLREGGWRQEIKWKRAKVGLA